MTLTYFLSDVAFAGTLHAGTNFFNYVAAAALAGGASLSWSPAATTNNIAVWTTPTGAPGIAPWPSGDYHFQLDVSAAGANISYGIASLGGINGHFASVNAAASAHVWTSGLQTEATFTGTGIKAGTVTWTTGGTEATGSRFEMMLLIRNLNSMSAQTLTMNVATANAFMDGPWGGGAPADDFPAGMVRSGPRWIRR